MTSSTPLNRRHRSGKRGNGEGSVYFDDRMKLWRATVQLGGGKRRYLSGKTRQEVAQKLTRRDARGTTRSTRTQPATHAWPVPRSVDGAIGETAAQGIHLRGLTGTMFSDTSSQLWAPARSPVLPHKKSSPS